MRERLVRLLARLGIYYRVVPYALTRTVKSFGVGPLSLWVDNHSYNVSWHWKWSITWRWNLSIYLKRAEGERLGFHVFNPGTGHGIVTFNSYPLTIRFNYQPNMERRNDTPI